MDSFKSRAALLLLLFVVTGCSSKKLLLSSCKSPYFEFQKTAEYQEKNKFQQDFLYVIECLKYRHPDMYHNYPEEQFEKDKEDLLRRLEGMENELEFQLAVQQFIARLRDAHTNLYLFELFESDDFFPVRFKWIREKLYIINVDQDLDDRYIGKEVLNIASMDVDDFYTKAASYFSAENDICIRNQLEYFMTYPDFYYKSGIADTTDNLSLIVDLNGTKKKIALFKKSSVDWREDVTPAHEITGKKDAKFDYSIYEEYDLAYLQFNKCVDRAVGFLYISDIPWFIYYPILGPIILISYPVVWCKQLCFGYHPYFSGLLEDLFDEIHECGLNNLVVDLRHNGGGCSLLGNQLIYYLEVPGEVRDYTTYNFVEYRKKSKTEPKENDFFREVKDKGSPFYISEPERRFKGKIYLITGADTASSACDFATVMSDNRLCVIVGQPTSGRPSSFGDRAFFRLPNTDNIISVSWKYFERPDRSKNNDVTLYPDVEIHPTIDDMLKGNDPVFDWIVEDIRMTSS